MEKIGNKQDIEKLLIQKRIAIDDNGFTADLVQRLPARKKSSLVIHLSLAMGIGFSFLWGGLEKTVYQISVFVNSLVKLQTPSADTLFIVACVVLTFILTSHLIFNKSRRVA